MSWLVTAFDMQIFDLLMKHRVCVICEKVTLCDIVRYSIVVGNPTYWVVCTSWIVIVWKHTHIC
jgi:hypothetical protein